MRRPEAIRLPRASTRARHLQNKCQGFKLTWRLVCLPSSFHPGLYVKSEVGTVFMQILLHKIQVKLRLKVNNCQPIRPKTSPHHYQQSRTGKRAIGPEAVIARRKGWQLFSCTNENPDIKHSLTCSNVFGFSYQFENGKFETSWKFKTQGMVSTDRTNAERDRKRSQSNAIRLSVGEPLRKRSLTPTQPQPQIAAMSFRRKSFAALN